MKYIKEYFFCSPKLLNNIDEIKEIEACISNIMWQSHFQISIGEKTLEHQTAYNKAFEIEFTKYLWEKQPLLYDNPRLIGDFRKIINSIMD